MSVRLSKICNEYNVGKQTIVDYLASCGYQIDSSPNTKLTDKQLELVAKKFGGRILAIHWKDDPFTLNPQENRNTINAHGWNHLRNDTFIITTKRYVLIPKEQTINKLLYWTIEDYMSKCPDATEVGYIIKERLSEPSGSLPVTPYIEEPNLTPPSQTQQPVSSPSVTVLGKITELKTVPTRRKKENGENRADQSAELVQAQIRDIWQRFVEIQEKLIKQRCAPISIIPDSIEVENDKLYVTVDESQNERLLDSILKDQLGLKSYNLEDDHILVDENRWNSLSENELNSIRKRLSECYVELDTTPTINATINYGGNLNRSDQLSIEELHQLDSILGNGILIEGDIEDTAAFISKVTILREDYLRYLFGDHFVVYEKKKKSWPEPGKVERFVYHNKYIPWDVMQQYAHIGLRCKRYTIIF